MLWRAGSSFALLTADGDQSLHASARAVAGEFAIIPPLLGSSQRLLNRDHYSVYYKVSCQDGTASPAQRLTGWYMHLATVAAHQSLLASK